MEGLNTAIIINGIFYDFKYLLKIGDIQKIKRYRGSFYYDLECYAIRLSYLNDKEEYVYFPEGYNMMKMESIRQEMIDFKLGRLKSSDGLYIISVDEEKITYWRKLENEYHDTLK